MLYLELGHKSHLGLEGGEDMTTWSRSSGGDAIFSLANWEEAQDEVGSPSRMGKAKEAKLILRV